MPKSLFVIALLAGCGPQPLTAPSGGAVVLENPSKVVIENAGTPRETSIEFLDDVPAERVEGVEALSTPVTATVTFLSTDCLAANTTVVDSYRTTFTIPAGDDGYDVTMPLPAGAEPNLAITTGIRAYVTSNTAGNARGFASTTTDPAGVSPAISSFDQAFTSFTSAAYYNVRYTGMSSTGTLFNVKLDSGTRIRAGGGLRYNALLDVTSSKSAGFACPLTGPYNACTPGATEIPDNGFDEDCDGFDGCSTEFCQTLEVTEVLSDPSGAADAVFLEIENTHPTNEIDLKGMQIVTGSGTFTVDAFTVVSPSERVIVAAGRTALGGLTIDGVAPGLSIPAPVGMGTSTIAFNDPTSASFFSLDLDNTFAGGTWPVGASVGFDGTDWCQQRSADGPTGNFATPGAANDSCTQVLQGTTTYNFNPSGTYTTPAITWTFLPDGSFSTDNDGSGTWESVTTAAGQDMTWTYDITGLTYEGSRTFGNDCFTSVDYPNLPTSVSSATFTCTDYQ